MFVIQYIKAANIDMFFNWYEKKMKIVFHNVFYL
jgi:hypothetical protein